MISDLVYRRTLSGDRLARREPAVQSVTDPEEWRILKLIEGDVHFEHLQKHARMPVAVLLGLLDRMVGDGLVTAKEPLNKQNLDFLADLSQGVPPPPPLSPGEKRILNKQAVTAHQMLTRTGSFTQLNPEDQMTHLGKDWNDIFILLVEDEAVPARTAQNIIMRAGFKQAHASNREEIIAALNKVVIPDCILLDIDLPGTNGFDILSRLRQHSRLKHVPVIIVTAEASKDDVIKGLRLGANAYISKPYKKQTLIDTIVRVLGLAPNKKTLPNLSEN